MNNRRAITAIMSVVLFLSFSVAVAAVVMNLGSAQVEEQAECPLQIGLHWAEIGGKQQICFDGAAISFVVENGINGNVAGLLVNIIGSNKAETVELPDATMSKAGSYVGKVAFDPAAGGEIRQVKISPKVLLKNEEEICLDQALVVENVGAC